jgi:hypothetical protein
MIKQDAARTGGALVYGSNIFWHLFILLNDIHIVNEKNVNYPA